MKLTAHRIAAEDAAAPADEWLQALEIERVTDDYPEAAAIAATLAALRQQVEAAMQRGAQHPDLVRFGPRAFDPFRHLADGIDDSISDFGMTAADIARRAERNREGD